MQNIFVFLLSMFFSIHVCSAEGGRLPLQAASENPNQLIERLLTVSGMEQSLQKLSGQTSMGFIQAALRNEASRDEQKEFSLILKEAFPEDVFVKRARAVLRENFDRQSYTHFLQQLATPLASRMTELEGMEPDRTELQDFFAKITKAPLSNERIKLIQRLDQATQASALLTTITLITLETEVLTEAGDCRFDIAKIKRTVEINRPEIEEASRRRVAAMFSFTYRAISDADLLTYVTIHEDTDARRIQDMVRKAIEGQFRLSMTKAAQGLKKIVLAHKPKQTMFAPKCGQSESPHEEEAIQKGSEVKQLAQERPVNKAATVERANSVDKTGGAERPPMKQEAVGQTAQPNQALDQTRPIGKAHRSPSLGRDLRDCLNLKTAVEIIACADK